MNQPTPLHEWMSLVSSDPDALNVADKRATYIIKAYQELLDGYATDPSTVLNQVNKTAPFTGTIRQSGIRFQSMCRHHMLPFVGWATVIFEPGEYLIGLGKLPRLVKVFAHRFQVQEHLTAQIVTTLMNHGVQGAYVCTSALHLCMCQRGPSEAVATTTIDMALGSLAGREAELRAQHTTPTT
jgi:GTP cyclohydrolase I